MAWPTIGQTGWGDDLLDTLGVELNSDGTLKNVVRPADLPYSPAFQALDIWDGFDSTGATAGSWNATTYAGWIGGIDALLADAITDGDVVKADLGVAADGASHIYSYTAGEGPIRALIVAGQHGEELFGMYASMRWFEQFATSDEVSCRQLRSTFRVTWIPSLNPGNYRVTRVNTNGVDLNRNYDLYWARAAETDKGTAPFDQPETQALKDLLDAEPFKVVIDCHNYTAQGNTMGFGLPGPWILGARQLGLDAISVWQSLYGVEWIWFGRTQTRPHLNSYATYHMWHLNGRTDSASFLIEGSQDLHGSSFGVVTRAAARTYAGMIHTYLLVYLNNGGRATAEPYPYSMSGYRATFPSTTIGSGGVLVDSTTAADFLVHHIKSDGIQVEMTAVPVPLLVTPCTLLVEVAGSLRSMGNAAGRHSVKVFIDGVEPAGGTAAPSVTATTNDTSSFNFVATRYYGGPLDNTNVPHVTFPIRRISGGAAEINAFTYKITVIPNTDGHPSPRVDGA